MRKQRRSTERPDIVLASNVKRTHVSWIDPGRIPVGKQTSLVGDPGLGKSGIALDYAARLSRGRAMPSGAQGDYYGEPVGSVVLSAEDDPGDTIRPRLEAMGADLSRIAILRGVVTKNGDRMPNLADLDAIEKAVKLVDAKLVIVDPLMAYMPGNINSYKDQDVRRALSPLCKLAQTMRFALLVVGHLTKPGEANEVRALYRAGGSIGIVGNARSVLLVAPKGTLS